MRIFREGKVDDYQTMIPELKSLVFGCWHVEPTIVVFDNDDGVDDGVIFDISHHDVRVDDGVDVHSNGQTMLAIVDLVSAFIDGYLLGTNKLRRPVN
jgi:hypothetical protein